MSRLLLPTSVLCLVAAIAVTVLGRSDGAAAQVPLPPVPTPQLPSPPQPQRLVLRVGDSMQVEGAALGCQVTRRGGRPTVECRRAGAVAKTYGTFFDHRGVTVARFKSPTVAQTILTARHGRGWRACRARSAAKASASCR